MSKLALLLLSPAVLAQNWMVTHVLCQEGHVREQFDLRAGMLVTDRMEEFHPLIISSDHGESIQALFIDDPRNPDRACDGNRRSTVLTISLRRIR